MRKSKLTHEKLMSSCRVFEAVTGVHPQDATPQTVRAFIRKSADSGKKATYINSTLRSLKSEFNIVYNSVKEPSRLPKALPFDELRKKIDLISDETLKCCCILGIDCGLRSAEILNAKFSDIDGDMIKVTGKGDKDRIVPIPSISKNTLKKLQKKSKSDYIAAFNGKRRSQSWLNLKVKEELGVTPHVLRHTYATALMQNGASILAVKKLLGHEKLSSTQVYTTFFTKEKKDAIRRQDATRLLNS